MWQEYVRHLLINTPLEEPAMKLRSAVSKMREDDDPKWKEVRAEDDYIDQMLPRLVKNGDNCVDIGGHLGSMVSKLKKLSPTGKHAVVEALPYKAAWLCEKFPGVTVHQVALSDKPGEATFYHQPKASGFSGLRFHGDEGTAANSITVRCERLDDLLPRDLPIHFIKIDIEGGERDALRGASETLTAWKPSMLFECTGSGTEAFGYTVADMYDLITGFGYEIFWIRDWLNGGAPLTRDAHTKLTEFPAQAFNFLAVHPDTKAARGAKK